MLLQTYPGLKKLPRIEFVTSSPVQKLTGLENELEFNGIWIKRDDLNSKKYGGNKVRKYEYILGDAINKKKKKIVTIGSIGSNQCVGNSILCREFNLESVVFITKESNSKLCQRQLKLMKYFDSKIIYHDSYFSTGLAVFMYLLTHNKTYFIFAGASNPLGTIGFINAIFELKEQINNKEVPEPDYIFVVAASTGTAAGLTLGCILAGLKTNVHGIAVSAKWLCYEEKITKIAIKTWKYLKKFDPSLPILTKKMIEDRFHFNSDFFGGEYGKPTPEGREAVDMIKKSDDISFDLTYTGKALAGLIAFVRKKRAEISGKNILFWNTLNGVDLSNEAETIDYHDLPKSLYKFFDGTIPTEE
ncbi:MAG: pyridoxal-phosphate dependent enzyme [archaeon]|nr:pyridoxal-phosphate dependent enzyme [archaeon]